MSDDPKQSADNGDDRDYPNPDLSRHQIDFALSLGLELKENEDCPAFIQRIEQRLGQKSMLELSRWFLLSILQHLQMASWNSTGASGIEEGQQYALAKEFIARDEFKQSLLVVLKDPRLRFTLVKFAKARNLEQRVLSSTTKAYRQGQELLVHRGLVDPAKVSSRGRRPVTGRSSRLDTAANRRAARRLSPVDTAAKVAKKGDTPASHNSASAMSEEEFEQLDKALGENKAKTSPRFTYQNNEERFSLLLGALAGSGLFLLVLLFFL